MVADSGRYRFAVTAAADRLSPPHPPSRVWQALGSGPVLMTLATLSFCIMAAGVKVARAELSPFEIIVWRGAVTVPLTLAIATTTGFRIHRWDVLLARSAFGFAAMGCFFTAAKGLPLADMSLITRLQPLVIAFLAPVVLGAREQTGPMTWIALTIGLVGCGILIGPELSVGSRYGLWALAATVLSAGAHTAVRALGHTDHPQAVVFWFQLFNVPAALLAQIAVFGAWPSMLPAHLIGTIIIVGLGTTGGQLLLTKAYQRDKATLVAAASYSGPIWSVMLDLAVFGIVPGWTLAAGGALVGLAAYVLYRSR